MAFTFFFRDAQTLELAIDEAIPSLQGRAFIHVWDAGCAHGPEPYTLAVLLRERMSDYVFRNVRIHATDIDASFAAQVTSGAFPDREVKRVPPKILDTYFRPAIQPGFVEVVPELRAKVTFSQHDLLSLRPVREGLSMIVCKNVLLHFDEAQRIEVLRMFHEALQPGGILVMEHTQKLPDALAGSFRQSRPHVQVYRKLDRAIVGHQAETGVPRGHRRQPADAPGDGSHLHIEHSCQTRTPNAAV
jgi:chemotaxis protein methyltransferase CheR